MNSRGIILALILFPALIFAQTEGAAEWGLDYDGRAIVAVLPLVYAEGDEEAALLFYGETIRAVEALGKYNPRRVEAAAFSGAGVEIPTDMPPRRDLAAGARYALTGGVYPGSRSNDYYLQLWLWDMSGSTMIYTDDLVYEDIDEALLSLPGLVEWLFSHIREIVIETPEPAQRRDPFLMAAVKAGLSQRWYTSPNELSAGAWALIPEAGISGALRLSSLFSVQAEILFSRDTVVYRGLDDTAQLYKEKHISYSLMFPLMIKLNFRPGPFRVSPAAGLYAVLPLGETQSNYRKPEGGEGEAGSYSWSYSLPLGFIVGLEAGIDYGPGMLFAGLRYSGDFSDINIDGGQSHRRNMVSVFLGYELGFFDKNKKQK